MTLKDLRLRRQRARGWTRRQWTAYRLRTATHAETRRQVRAYAAWIATTIHPALMAGSENEHAQIF